MAIKLKDESDNPSAIIPKSKKHLIKFVDDAIEFGHSCSSKRGRKKKKVKPFASEDQPKFTPFIATPDPFQHPAVRPQIVPTPSTSYQFLPAPPNQVMPITFRTPYDTNSFPTLSFNPYQSMGPLLPQQMNPLLYGNFPHLCPVNQTLLGPLQYSYPTTLISGNVGQVVLNYPHPYLHN